MTKQNEPKDAVVEYEDERPAAKSIATAQSGRLQMMEIQDLEARQKAIVRAMSSVMTVGTHYGPPYKGSTKHVLLKAGAEVLGVLFKLAPSYRVERIDMPDGHREYSIVCELHFMPTGTFVAEGLGSCSTLEKKYRYRTIDEATGVPSSYEDNKIKQNQGFAAYTKHLKDKLDAAGVNVPPDASVGVTKTDSGEWEIAIKGKGENPDIADEYNTVLKIAKKRAHIDAILNATGASELFTQDVDDFDDYDPTGTAQNSTQTNANQGHRQNTRQPDPQPQAGQTRPVKQQANEPEDIPDDVPLHLMQKPAGVQAWTYASKIKNDSRSTGLKAALSDKSISEAKVLTYAKIGKMYSECELMIHNINKLDPADASGWLEALKAAERPNELKVVWHGLKQRLDLLQNHSS